MDSNLGSWGWLSLNWFSWEAFNSYSWEYGSLLYLLMAIPIFFLIKWLLTLGKRRKLPVALPEKELKWRPENLLRHIPAILLSLIFALGIVALARPQITNQQVEQWSEGIDIMLVLDISESMKGMDLRPNRLDAARRVAYDFIAGRSYDRIGIVVFAGEAFSLSPLTTDYGLLTSLVQEIDYNMVRSSGTAIGSAIAVGVNRLIESEVQSKVMILMSDGENNAGNIDPLTAAEIARAYDIKIYTIAIGREGRVPYPGGVFGQTRYFDNTLDETALRQIAEMADGHFFRASDEQSLDDIFDLIDSYEKAEIKETRYSDTVDYYRVYLMWAMALFLVWLFLKSTFISNALVD
jgi:Ca-activated chloride channel homolog